ncbi:MULTISPECIES: TetR/AcrR family transcriptional regulator [unclassified Embleya]|uniref:TetR/AcrR family transcriptional regulator n=1 Tax=unclassified Embleya TaxID=2699296 RepID=UPI0033DBDDB7
MARRKTEPEALPRREVILSEAATLFARKGVVASTIREIADASGILAGSLYHWFGSKEDLIDEILTAAMRDLSGWYDEAFADARNSSDRLRGLVHAAFLTIEHHPDAATMYVRDYAYLATLPRFAHLAVDGMRVRDLWLDTLREGIESGEFRADLDPELVYRYLAYPLWLTAGWKSGTDRTLPELEAQFTALVLEGVTPRN